MINLKTISFLAFAALNGGAMVLAKAPDKPSNVISERHARQVALKVCQGEVKDSELEYERGRWIYSYDIADSTGNGSIHEVQIDAITGRLVSQTTETPQSVEAEQIGEK